MSFRKLSFSHLIVRQWVLVFCRRVVVVAGAGNN